MHHTHKTKIQMSSYKWDQAYAWVCVSTSTLTIKVIQSLWVYQERAQLYKPFCVRLCSARMLSTHACVLCGRQFGSNLSFWVLWWYKQVMSPWCTHTPAPERFPLSESSVQTSTTSPAGVSSSSLHSLLLLVSHFLCFCLPRLSFPLSFCPLLLLLCHFLPLWSKKGRP